MPPSAQKNRHVVRASRAGGGHHRTPGGVRHREPDAGGIHRSAAATRASWSRMPRTSRCPRAAVSVSSPIGITGRCGGRVDTVLIAGGAGTRGAARSELLAWLRKMAKQARRMCSICTGAFLLADAGLLDGKRATTHWRFVESFARKHPAVSWDPNPIFVQDGNIYTSAGHLRGHGSSPGAHRGGLRKRVGAECRAPHGYFSAPARKPGAVQCRAGRAGSRAQESAGVAGLDRREPRQGSVSRGFAGAGGNESAQFRASVCPRVGQTPARYVEQVRVEAARTQLAATDDNVDQIASRCGFSSAELLRRCFLRHFKVAPSQYRKHFRTRLGRPHRRTASRDDRARRTRTSRRPGPASADILPPGKRRTGNCASSIKHTAIAADGIRQGFARERCDDDSLPGEAAGVEQAGLDLPHERQARGRDGECPAPRVLDTCVAAVAEKRAAGAFGPCRQCRSGTGRSRFRRHRTAADRRA